MRDVRFDLDYGGSRVRHQNIEVGCRVMSEPWVAVAVDIVRAWCLTVIHREDVRQAADEERALVPDQALHDFLRECHDVPPDRAAALGLWTPYTTMDGGDPEIDWVWGAALAEAGTALAPAFDATAYTWRTARHRDVTAVAYLTGLAAALRRDQRLGVLSILQEVVERIRTLQGCFAPRNDREPFAAALKSWQESARLPDVWNLRSLEQYPVSCHDVWLLDAARRFDRTLFLELLEETYNPVVIMQALTVPEVMEDSTEILELLAVAPAVQGRPEPGVLVPRWNHRLTAPLLLQTALDHCRRLGRLLLQDYRAESHQPEVIDGPRADLSTEVDRVMRVLLGREDGVALACEWLLHLARSVAHTPWSTPLVPDDVALRAVARSVKERGVDEATLRRETSRLNDEIGGIDLLLALLAMEYELTNVPPGSEEPDAMPVPATGSERLMGLFTSLLDQGDRDLSLYRDTNPPSLGHAYAALLFAGASDPIRSWDSVWLGLAEQRRKMFYRRYEPGNVFDDPSLFVLYTGIAALQWIWPDEGRNDRTVALHLWERLADSALSVTLRLGPFHRRWPRVAEWRRVVIMLAAVLPHASHAVEDGSHEARLTTFLHRLGGDDELIVQCVAFLYRNGASLVGLSDALAHAGIDLDASAARYANLLGDKRRPVNVGGYPSVLDDCRIISRHRRTVSL